MSIECKWMWMVVRSREKLYIQQHLNCIFRLYNEPMIELFFSLSFKSNACIRYTCCVPLYTWMKQASACTRRISSFLPLYACVFVYALTEWSVSIEERRITRVCVWMQRSKLFPCIEYSLVISLNLLKRFEKGKGNVLYVYACVCFSVHVWMYPMRLSVCVRVCSRRKCIQVTHFDWN